MTDLRAGEECTSPARLRAAGGSLLHDMEPGSQPLRDANKTNFAFRITHFEFILSCKTP